MQQERHHFQAETKRLLDLMINSVYSNRDIFLRELVSNASDALDKRRLELASTPELAEGLAEPLILLSPGESGGKKTLEVSDNGIGMNRDELKDYIGTIARSGASEFLESLGEGGGEVRAETLIGQFGVGFYSAFMVADRVDVLTRRLGEADGWLFSSTGDGTYTIEKADREVPGTTVTLFLKAPDTSRGEKDYSSEWTIREIVKKYSDFILYPVMLESGEGDGKKEERLNFGKPIWRRPERDVTDEEYSEFYKLVAHDWADPARRIVFSVEGGTEFRGVLFIPSKAPFDLMFPSGREGVSLYIKNVFIMNDCKELVPSWLRFLRGVVDSEDLPLNISREMLQEDPLLRVIRKSITRRVVNSLKKMLSDEREKYEELWGEFGQVIKEGLVSFEAEDGDNRDAILDLCLFHTTSGDGLTTLGEYVDSMPEGQEHIYHLTGTRLKTLRGSPLLERCAESGHSVLLMTDPVDEVAAPAFTEYSGREFRSLELADSLPGKDGESEPAEASELVAFLKEALGDRVEDVRPSNRLTSSPACLVTSDGATFSMERLLKSMGRQIPAAKRVLEVNLDHSLIRLLERRLEEGMDKDSLVDHALLLYE
ncbi:MAG: molecular chaperone HtpG, partial [Synergistaceae bacterium]|nr:molecular chaperone HtpG [Synergistaceae bacterium]